MEDRLAEGVAPALGLWPAPALLALAQTLQVLAMQAETSVPPLHPASMQVLSIAAHQILPRVPPRSVWLHRAWFGVFSSARGLWPKVQWRGAPML